MALVLNLLLALLAYGLYRLLQVGKRHPRMPPGPPTLPIIGNAHQIPKTGMFKKFKVWADEYGPIYSLKVGPSNIIVLTDRNAVNALMEKKSLLYADRPHSYVMDYVTHGAQLTLESGRSWRDKRAIITQNFSPKLLDEKHWRVQEAEAVIFMNNILKSPEDIFKFAKLYTASVASALVWGHRAKNLDSFWYKELYALMEEWLEVQEPGANPPIDEFPILKYWPGSWYKRATHLKNRLDTMWDTAREIVDERRARGDIRDCLIDQKIAEYNEKGWPFSQQDFNSLFGEIVEGGADTTANQLLTLILAFAKHPEVQQKARVEIDAVCGVQRAPLFTDFADLPYINAIIKEGLRWRPTAGLGLPHMATQDDEYEGMFIPKGSTVFVGIWAMHRNEEEFPNNNEFNPDRYLNFPKLAHEYANAGDPKARDHYSYGAGRRSCPGIHLAERSQWRIAAKLLWAFDISEPIDPKTGQVVPLDQDAYVSANLTCPMPYTIRIKPRSPEHLAVIQQELSGALEFMSPWD